MKKYFTFILSMLVAAYSFAQSPKMVFVEEGTQASCGPCASQNPDFDALLSTNSDKVVVLKYHTSWPGFDQMNLDNPTEVQNRVDYYSIDGVPMGFVNGDIIANDCGAYDGAPSCLSQDEIDAEYSSVAAFDITITTAIANGQLSITGTVVANSSVSGDLKLRMAIAEKNIEYADVPGGTNGETEFHHVMKKFINGVAGIALENSWSMGDSYTINETFDLGAITVYNYSELEVIAFIQDDATKEVHQAAKSTEIPITVDFAINGSAAAVSGLPNSICSGPNTITPIFKLQNNGNDNLVSADIVYSVNGGDEQTYSWTGDIATMANYNITLDPIDFVANEAGDNILSVTVTNVNGSTDEDMSDNNLEQLMLLSNETTNTVQIHILTDDYADEIYWEIRDGAGSVYAHGGNPNVGIDNVATGTFPPPASSESYANNAEITTDIDIDSDDCYTFHITDYYGDGILGAGYYEVKDNSGVVIIAENDLVGEEINNFTGKHAVGIDENTLSSSFAVFPNPVSDIANVSFTTTANSNTSIEMFNMLGDRVYVKSFSSLSEGAHVLNVNVKDMESGIYFLSLTSNGNVSTKKILVNR